MMMISDVVARAQGHFRAAIVPPPSNRSITTNTFVIIIISIAKGGDDIGPIPTRFHSRRFVRVIAPVNRRKAWTLFDGKH
jgi:hypothetical protein